MHGGGVALAHIGEGLQLGAHAGFVALVLRAGNRVVLQREAMHKAVLPAVVQEPQALVAGEEHLVVHGLVAALVEDDAERHAAVVAAGAGIIAVLLRLVDERLAGIAAFVLRHRGLEHDVLLLIGAVALVDDVVFIPLLLGVVEAVGQRLDGRGEQLDAAGADAQLHAEALGVRAHAHQRILAEIIGAGVPLVDQQHAVVHGVLPAHGLLDGVLQRIVGQVNDLPAVAVGGRPCLVGALAVSELLLILRHGDGIRVVQRLIALLRRLLLGKQGAFLHGGQIAAAQIAGGGQHCQHKRGNDDQLERIRFAMLTFGHIPYLPFAR